MSTLADTILQTLADEIIAGELPPGSKLEEKALIERFGVSRTPIREALRGLSGRGLITLVRRQGGVVSTISIDELADMLEAECSLEALCAKLSAQRMRAVDKSLLQQVHGQMMEQVKRGDNAKYLTLNKQFHDLICEGTGSNTLAQMVHDLRARLAPFRQAQRGVKGRLPSAHTEHDAVLAAILRSDGEAAYEAMREHTARLGTNVLEQMRATREERQGRKRKSSGVAVRDR